MAWWIKNGDKVNKQIFKHKNPRTNCSYNAKMSQCRRMYWISWRRSQHTIMGCSQIATISLKPAMTEFVLEVMQYKFLDVAQVNLSRPLSEEEVRML